MDLYRKYRPKKLSEISGQRHVVATLKKSSIKNKFAHAYVFAGERGTGKTTTARILSALLNDDVENGDLIDCNSDTCQSIFNGATTEVIELDGAKSRKVEDIDHIFDSVRFSPIQLKKKVYIIDECHQLSPTAISSLLKIVEEPPSYVVFIFCTTEIHKIPSTILSRAQQFVFHKISVEDISKRLSHIALKENIDISDDAISYIAEISNGALRDAIGFLQQIATVAGNSQIQLENAQKYFGKSSNRMNNLFKNIMEKNILGCFTDINDIYSSNIDLDHILKNISELFRKFMLFKIDKNSTGLISSDINFFTSINSNASVENIIEICKIFSKIKFDLEYNINKRWVIESFIVESISKIN